jgi:U-box domain
MPDVDDEGPVCPITHEPFRDPVTAKDGRVYERAAITQWVSEHGTSPFTRQPLQVEDFLLDGNSKPGSSLQSSTSVSYTTHGGVVTLPPLRLIPPLHWEENHVISPSYVSSPFAIGTNASSSHYVGVRSNRYFNQRSMPVKSGSVCIGVVSFIIAAILALVLGLVFGLRNSKL